MSKSRLWRVDAVHVRGYHAPLLYVETESPRRCDAETEAINKAEKLSPFATGDRFKLWSVEVSQVERRQLDGKWLTKEYYERKTGKEVESWP